MMSQRARSSGVLWATLCQPLPTRRWEAMAVYSMIAGCGAMGIDVCPGEWFTLEEYYRCWASKNLTQYLKYSASEVSDIPMMMPTPLLKALIAGIDTL